MPAMRHITVPTSAEESPGDPEVSPEPGEAGLPELLFVTVSEAKAAGNGGTGLARRSEFVPERRLPDSCPDA